MKSQATIIPLFPDHWIKLFSKAFPFMNLKPKQVTLSPKTENWFPDKIDLPILSAWRITLFLVILRLS